MAIASQVHRVARPQQDLRQMGEREEPRMGLAVPAASTVLYEAQKRNSERDLDVIRVAFERQGKVLVPVGVADGG